MTSRPRIDWDNLTCENIHLGDIFIVLGLVGIVFAVWGVVGALLDRRGRSRHDGAVADHESHEHEGDTFYDPLVEYEAPGGERRRVKVAGNHPKPLPTDGTVLATVWHHPSDPARTWAELDPKSGVPMAAWLGVPFLVLAAGIALRLGLF